MTTFFRASKKWVLVAGIISGLAMLIPAISSAQSTNDPFLTRDPVKEDAQRCQINKGTPIYKCTKKNAGPVLPREVKENEACAADEDRSVTCKQAPAAATPAPGTAQSTGNTPSGVKFVPLTQLPAIQEAGDADTLPAFLNQLYKICIGISAVLAILMIMWAGVDIMTSQGSVMSNEKAKSRIQNAVLGLILVLSPVVVFSVINEDILKLDLNFSALQPTSGSDDPLAGSTFGGRDAALWTVITTDKAVDTKRCAASNGTPTYGCNKKDNSSGRTVSATESCKEDEHLLVRCTSKVSQPASYNQCEVKYTEITSVTMNPNNTCNTTEGFEPVSHGCCLNGPMYGNLCCAKPKK